jgi:CheY-like chemotaxis protein
MTKPTDRQKTYGDFDLYDILVAIGEPAINTIWSCKNIECLGKGAQEIQTCDNDKVQISGKDLCRISSRIYQTIEGHFEAHRRWSNKPWLVIRAVDGSGFDISTRDRRIIARLKNCFRDVEDIEAYQPKHKCVHIRNCSGKERSHHVQRALDLMMSEEEEAESEAPGLDISSNKSLKILFICNNLDIDGMLIKRVFKTRNDDVIVTRYNQQTLAVAERNQPDMIIVEATLPGVDVFQVYQQLRAMPMLQKTPVLFWRVPNAQDMYPKAQTVGVAGCMEFVSGYHTDKLLEARDVIAEGSTYYPAMEMLNHHKEVHDNTTHPQHIPSPRVRSTQDFWNPDAYAEEMRHSTSPVSAFFLIDSLEAISKCIQWLSLLKAYNMPSMEDSQYFKSVRKVYESGRSVTNYDYDFTLLWENQEYSARLRCHFVDKGQYEIELWLPGVIANDVADAFKDGREGFFCAFMPPLFYD